MLMAAVTCVGFASCSEDEENVADKEVAEDEEGTSSVDGYSILGTWKWVYDHDEWWEVTFDKDGTGVMIEYDDDDPRGEYDTFEWKLLEDRLIIVWDENGDRKVWDGIRITKKELFWDYEEPGTVWHRQ